MCNSSCKEIFSDERIECESAEFLDSLAPCDAISRELLNTHSKSLIIARSSSRQLLKGVFTISDEAQ